MNPAMISGAVKEEGRLLLLGQDGVGDRRSILVQAVKNWQWRAVEVLTEMAHYGCQAAPRTVHGTRKHPARDSE